MVLIAIVMTIGLFVAGIVCASLVGTAAFPGSAFPGSAAAYGRLAIPGSAVLRLPRGTVDVDMYGPAPLPSAGLAVIPLAPGAPRPAIRTSVGPANIYNYVYYQRVAKLEVPRAGAYRVQVSGGTGHELLFGHPTGAGFLEPTGAGFLERLAPFLAAIALVWLIAGARLLVLRGRRREQLPPAPAATPRAGTFEQVEVVNASGEDPARVIAKLKQLRDQGLISERQFEAARCQLPQASGADVPLSDQ